MNKIDWKRKLTSRKFWAALITFIMSLMVFFGVPDVTQQQIVAIIVAGSGFIAYIIGEGMVDAAREKNAIYWLPDPEEPEEGQE